MSGGNYTGIDNQKLSGSVPAVPDPGQVTVKFSDSNLQTFPPSDTRGKISGVSGPPSDVDDTFSKPASGSSDEAQSSGWFRAFTVAAYKPYFDVDTSDVLERIKDSLFHSEIPLLKKHPITQICMDHFGYALPLYLWPLLLALS